jgi:hypothetical protein
LLLSATGKEVAEEPALVGAAEPTIANLESAIGGWYGAMKALPRPAAQQSRAVLFFSGHGVEVLTNRQLLLPSDYLRPPVENLNDAVSTAFTVAGLSGLAVPQVVFFLDACRNDVPRLRNQDVEGRKLLPIPVAAETNPDQVSLLYYAAASGQQTWQPFEVKDRASVFGRALFDGLVASPGVELRCGEESCSIDAFPLHAYLKQRVAAILSDYQSQEKARVRLGGTVDDLPLTTVPPPKKVRGIPKRTVRPLAETLAARYSVHEPDLGAVPTIWEQAKVVSLSDSGKHDLRLLGVDRSDESDALRVEFELPHDPIGHWLQLATPTGAEWACVLGDAPRFTVEIGFDQTELSRLEAGLSVANVEPWNNAARVWETYENSHLGAAVQEVDLSLMGEVLYGKHRSPLSATVAGTILLRARRFDLLHDWLANLSEWFNLPDAPVLWSEQVRLAKGWSEEAVGERLQALERLASRGLPQLSEVFTMASEALEDLENRGLLTPATGKVLERFRSLRPSFRPGGLFTVFAGPPGSLGPELLKVPG